MADAAPPEASGGSPALEIRTMRREELAFALDLAAAEGWNPGLHDDEAFWAADPSGFLVGLVGGVPVGCVSAVRYGEDGDGGGTAEFGFVGFYIVLPEHRGKGHGLALWRAGMGRLAGCRNVGLDGVVAQQPNYRRSGFAYAYPNVRYKGPAWPSDKRAVPGGGDGKASWRIVHAADVPINDICAYDRRVFPAKRRAFLERWTRLPDSTSLACVVRLSTEGGAAPDRLLGFGVVRKCRRGHKVAPLCADTPEVAAALLDALVATAAPGDDVMLDCPDANAAAAALAASRGMARGFETARMYTSGEPEGLELACAFAVASFELG